MQSEENPTDQLKEMVFKVLGWKGRSLFMGVCFEKTLAISYQQSNKMDETLGNMLLGILHAAYRNPEWLHNLVVDSDEYVNQHYELWSRAEKEILGWYEAPKAETKLP